MAETTLSVTSTTFEDGATLPTRAAFAAAGGQDVSPALGWSAGPPGTAAYALALHDPDAPTSVGFTHWLVFNLPSSVTALAEGAGSEDRPVGGISGYTDWGQSRYGGMAPPPGDEPHRYQFTVYALDTDTLPLDPSTTYAKFRFLIRGHVLASGTITGRFGL